jgi:hypothetical protein
MITIDKNIPKDFINDIEFSIYSSLATLGFVLNLSPKFIRFNDNLLIEVQGKNSSDDSNTLAYSTNDFKIKLYYPDGKGSLAHEWFHLLDNYLGIIFFNGNSLASQYIQKHHKNDLYKQHKIIEAFKGLLKYMNDKVIPSFEKLDSNRQHKYLISIEEVMARSFEAYIHQKIIESRVLYDEFLTNNPTEMNLMYMPDQNQSSKAYKLFDELFMALTDLDIQLNPNLKLATI